MKNIIPITSNYLWAAFCTKLHAALRCPTPGRHQSASCSFLNCSSKEGSTCCDCCYSYCSNMFECVIALCHSDSLFRISSPTTLLLASNISTIFSSKASTNAGNVHITHLEMPMTGSIVPSAISASSKTGFVLSNSQQCYLGSAQRPSPATRTGVGWDGAFTTKPEELTRAPWRHLQRCCCLISLIKSVDVFRSIGKKTAKCQKDKLAQGKSILFETPKTVQVGLSWGRMWQPAASTSSDRLNWNWWYLKFTSPQGEIRGSIWHDKAWGH